MDWKDKLAALANKFPESSVESISEPEAGSVGDEILQGGTLRILLDKKGRNGKTATIIEGFEISDEVVAVIASEMKRKIGAGGSVRGGEILLQGDKRQQAVKFLNNKGFKTKLI